MNRWIHFMLKSENQRPSLLGQQGLLPGRLPDSKAEPDLVHEVSHVVDEVQRSIIHGAHEVSEEVSQRVDGPTDGDDETHHVEGALDGLGCTLSALGTLTCEDLEQDEAPAGHAQCEADVGVDHLSLTKVAEEQHADGAEEETEEHARAKVGLHCGKNQVELNHLQRHGQRPIDVAVHDWAHVNLDPVLTHVEVMHSRNEGDKGTDVHGSLPSRFDAQALHQEEASGCHHGN